MCIYVHTACIVDIWLSKLHQQTLDPESGSGFQPLQDIQRFPVQFVLIIYTFILVWSVGSLV